jgi:hypothetical protein
MFPPKPLAPSLKVLPVAALFAVALFAVSCSKKNDSIVSIFNTEPDITSLSTDFPGEVSGIADSYLNPGWLWMIQDGGNPAELLCVKHSGEYGAKIILEGISNRDWEDMAIVESGDGGAPFIYIADIGDNHKNRGEYNIYRLREPRLDKREVTEIEKITFRYSDDISHDADAFLVAGQGKEIYLLTKENPTLVFRISNVVSGGMVQTAQKLGSLKIGGITSSAISRTGEILVRTYNNLYFWPKTGSTGVYDMLKKKKQEIPIHVEPQGEAVTFGKVNSGIFTLSENAGLPLNLSLYFYPRN